MKKRTAIIIVTWNHWETTSARALAAVAAFTDVPYRVDVIDNASGDQTRSELTALAQRDPRLRLHFLDANLGWAEATRIGLARLLPGDTHICLLNSDTQPTPRWLSKLHRHLEKTPGLTCISPVEDPRPHPAPKRTVPPLADPGSYAAPLPWPRRRVMRAAFECEAREKGRSVPAAPSAFCLLTSRRQIAVLDHYLADFETFRLGHRDWQAYLDANRLTAHAALDTFVYHQRGGSGGYYDYTQTD